MVRKRKVNYSKLGYKDLRVIADARKHSIAFIQSHGIRNEQAELIYKRALNEMKKNGGSGMSKIKLQRLVLTGLIDGKIKFTVPRKLS